MVKTQLINGFENLVKQAGRGIIVNYYNKIEDNVYDETVSVQLSGSALASGIILPIDDIDGSRESLLLEQGQLTQDDRRLYVGNSVELTGSSNIIKVIIGGDAYTTIPIGVIGPEAEGQKIYKKVFIRRLTNGSLIGE